MAPVRRHLRDIEIRSHRVSVAWRLQPESPTRQSRHPSLEAAQDHASSQRECPGPPATPSLLSRPLADNGKQRRPALVTRRSQAVAPPRDHVRILPTKLQLRWPCQRSYNRRPSRWTVLARETGILNPRSHSSRVRTTMSLENDVLAATARASWLRLCRGREELRITTRKSTSLSGVVSPRAWDPNK